MSDVMTKALEGLSAKVSSFDGVAKFVIPGEGAIMIDQSGVRYQLTPMGTILEGEWDEVMGVVTACFEALKTDCPRISTQLKIDYRAGTESRMQSKIAAVESHLGRKLST